MRWRVRLQGVSEKERRAYPPRRVADAHTAVVRAQRRDDQELIVVKNLLSETEPERARAEARDRVAMCLGVRQYRTPCPRYGFDESDNVEGGSDRLIVMLVAWGDRGEIHARQTSVSPRTQPMWS